jgi:hypothetical protein
MGKAVAATVCFNKLALVNTDRNIAGARIRTTIAYRNAASLRAIASTVVKPVVISEPMQLAAGLLRHQNGSMGMLIITGASRLYTAWCATGSRSFAIL